MAFEIAKIFLLAATHCILRESDSNPNASLHYFFLTSEGCQINL